MQKLIGSSQMTRHGSNLKDFIRQFQINTTLVLIKASLDIMKSENVSVEEYVQADVEFHLQIARATHNSVLLVILETLRPL